MGNTLEIVLFVRIYHFEAHLMVSSRAGDS